MSWFRRNNNTQDYLATSEGVSRPLAAIFTLVLIFGAVLVLFGLFFGGRWLAEHLDGSDQPGGSTVVVGADSTNSPATSSITSDSGASTTDSNSDKSSMNSEGTSVISGSGSPSSSQSSGNKSSSTSTVSSSTSLTASGPTTAESIPATGPESVFVLFMATVILTTMLHSLWRRFAKSNC